LETDVRVSSPSSSPSPPPSPFLPPRSPSFTPLLGIRQEGVELTDRWDEWVPEARLLKLNEAGFNKRKQLADQQTQKSRSIGVGGASPAIKEKGKGKKGGETKKRARDSGIESVCLYPFSHLLLVSHDLINVEIEADLQESEYIQKPEVKIVIPDVLKLQLVDDWENVTKNNQASHVNMNVVNED
jgi:hypothetical protein